MRNGADKLESSEYYRKLLDMAVLAGEIMIRSGAETHRVEDTLQRILGTSNFAHAESFVFTTGLIVTLSDPASETLSITQRISGTSQNLGRVAEVNSVSRNFCDGKITLDEAIAKLRVIKNKRQYSDLLTVLGILLASSGFAIVFGGSFLDALGALFCGLLLSGVLLVLGPKIGKTFITSVLGAAVITVGATAFSYFAGEWTGLAFHSQYMIVGSMMPLVPGLALTNAIRDTLQGDYISAGSRMIEALMIAASVALGVGAGLSLSGAAGLSSALNFTFDLSVHDAFAFLKAVIFSSIAILGFALYFEIPKRYLIPVGVIALVSWAVFLVSDSLGLSTAWASFFAALVSDFLAYFCARTLKAPVILFLLGGILPLVPGVGIYRAVYNMIYGMESASQVLVETLLITGAIALAIFVMDTLIDIEKRVRRYFRARRASRGKK